MVSINFIGASLLVLVLACSSEKGDENVDPTSSSGSKQATVKKVLREPDVRDGYRLFRSLLKEVSRAEVRVGGPLIDFGTRDQNKYTRGGWATGWSMSEDTKTSAARLSGGEGFLNTFMTSEVEELVVRARSMRGPQDLRFSVGGKSLGQVSLRREWQILRLPIQPLGMGRKKIELEHDKSSEVEIDWLWMSEKSGQKAPALIGPTGPATLDKKLRRALLAKGPRSYSYYMHIPRDATLIFDYGSSTAMEFVVSAQTVDGSSSELFRANGEAVWKTAKVDLRRLAGKALRLELRTEGEAGKIGQEGAWGEPGIFVVASDERASATIASATKATNLVLVVLDTTRADQFESYSAGNGIHTPNLDAFSKTSTAFTRAYDNANWTKPSVLSILSSIYPATHTATKPESMVPADIGLISEHLQKHGLKTQGFSSNPVVSEKFGFERGWDGYGLFYDHEARGASMYERATQWVEDNGDEPFFLYIQTIDPHTTYSVSREYWSRYYHKNYSGQIGSTFTRENQSMINDRKITPSSDDVAWIQALYHGEITYQDEHVGGFLDSLAELGRLEDTIVVVTNDHGEEIYDHGSFGHGWSLYEEMIRAPLMIHYPPLFPVGSVSRITEHVDLAPTLLEALGIPPMAGAEGTSFLSALHGGREQEPPYAISISDNGRRSIHVGDWKLEVSERSGWRFLFEITGEEGESRDRRNDAELAGRLCEIYMGEGMANPNKLQRLTGMAGGRKIKAQDANMDEETRRQMEALGYL